MAEPVVAPPTVAPIPTPQAAPVVAPILTPQTVVAPPTPGALPEAQTVSIPSAGMMPAGRAVYRRRTPLSRGSTHLIEESNAAGGAGPGSGLQAMITPTPGTHAGGTILSQVGNAAGSGGPRLVIPLPAALATATALSTGEVVPQPAVGAKGTAAVPTAPVPSMHIDTEWFLLQSYPPELQEYLNTIFSFDLRPTTPGSVVELTQDLLRSAYHSLVAVGLDIKIAPGLKILFTELTSKSKTDTTKFAHLYGESEATNNGYLVLAYTMSTLLWATDRFGIGMRNYPEVTYPGVIITSFLSRLTMWYHDVSGSLGLLGPPRIPYLYMGGNTNTNDAWIASHPGEASVPKPAAINNIPKLARQLKLSAQFATARLTYTPDQKCTGEQYAALQDLVLNKPGVPLGAGGIKAAVLTRLQPEGTPLEDKINSARCLFLQGIVRGTIKPEDLGATIASLPAGGAPGIEPLNDV